MKKIYHVGRGIGLVLLFLFMALGTKAVKAEEYITDPNQLPDVNAFKAVVLIKAFTSVDGDNLQQYSAGSGVMISSDGVILTNYHVVTLEDEFKEGEYQSVYQVCLSSSIDMEPDCHYAAKMLAKDKDQDLALLKIEPITALSEQTNNFKYLTLASSDGANVNDTVIAMGYPSIGGGTITITKGILSGKEEKFNIKWIKTDAAISFGSSGGAAINSQGNVIGLVNSSHADYLSSLGYLINVASIYDWVNAHKNVSSQNNSYLEDLKALTKKQSELKNSNIFSNNYFSVTKPANWEFVYNHEYEINMYNPSDDDGGFVTIKMFKYPHELSLETAISLLKYSFVKNGILTVVNLTSVEDTLINGKPAKKIVMTYGTDTETLYYLVNKNYLIEVDYDYGVNNKDEQLVRGIINSITLISNNSSIKKESQYINTSPQFSIKTNADWYILSRNDKEYPVFMYNKKYPEAYISINVDKGDENVSNYNNQQYLDYIKQLLSTANAIGPSKDFSVTTLKEDANYYLNNTLSSVLLFEANYKKISSGEVLLIGTDYTVKSGDKHITISFDMFTGDSKKYQEALDQALPIIKTFSLSSTPNQGDVKTETVKKDSATPSVSLNQGSLLQRLKGRILLQVESHGEAWYVKPDSGKRVYLKDGEAAYSLMRTLGLGITNSELQKIPIGFEDRFQCDDSDKDGLCDKLEDGLGSNPNNSDSDNDGQNDGMEVKNGNNPIGPGKLSSDNSLINRLKGKIVLQVQAHGEAWYINPVDGKRYYMPDGPSAYQIMRYLSLGISNKDLNKVTTD